MSISSTGPASQILFRTAIAAVNSGSSIRVFTQDALGNIRQTSFDNGWTGGTTKEVIAQAKLGSPIAATTKKLTETRVFYISTDNKLREIVFNGSAWSAGPINANNFAVAPYSKIAAKILPDASGAGVRVYVQNEDNTIQEYALDNSTTWVKTGNLGAALPGTALAAAAFQRTNLTVRVYFQTEDLKLVEKAYDVANKWANGVDTKLSIPPRASISISTWGINALYVRLFSTTATNTILQNCIDNHATDGGSYTMSTTIAGTESAAVAWGNSEASNLEMRLLFQDGTGVAGISDWAYSNTAGGWHKATPAIAIAST